MIEVETGCDKRRVLLEVEERREERRANDEECRILLRCPIN
jgi:hypothetical protein